METTENKSEIQYFNRKKNQLEIEKVYGDALVRWLYCSPSGKFLTNILCRAPMSKAYGLIQDNAFLSGRKVRPFIKEFNIPIDIYEPGSLKSSDIRDSYASFNEFFIRRFKPGQRPIVENEKMAAFSEARYLGFESINPDQTFPVKGQELTAKALLNNTKLANEFEDGPLMIARLCPVDYHRFHFPDDGTVESEYRVSGLFHSVNPVALRFKDEVFSENERHVSILNTKNFGKIAYIEVGAICVGKIVQSYTGKTFTRGQEKGYFLFGASTVIVLGEKGKWSPSKDILENSKKQIETYIELGDEVGVKLK